MTDQFDGAIRRGIRAPHRRHNRSLAVVAAVTMAVLATGCGVAGAGNPEFAAPQTVAVPAGPFIAGSSAAEREAAYLLDERAYGHTVTRDNHWYGRERRPTTHELPAYEITRTPITNAQYAVFLSETGHRAPDVEPDLWASYRLVHPFERTRRHAWRDGVPPEGREDHPVVLVSHGDAESYARWLSDRTGQSWRLPTELEWEKAARGVDGRRFPWGEAWSPDRLNSADRGPFDTVPVAAFPAGASPFGLLDAAGQVFEWTSSPGNPRRFLVKGGSWDDRGCGVCRPAARHARPEALKHILIGFRLVRELS